MNLKKLTDIFDEKDLVRLKKLKPLVLFLIAGGLVLYFLDDILFFLIDILALNVALFSAVILFWGIATLLSAGATKVLMSYFTGKYAESVSPLSSLYSDQEALFNEQWGETRGWTDAGLRFTDSAGRVITARHMLAGKIFISCMLLFAVMFFTLFINLA